MASSRKFNSLWPVVVSAQATFVSYFQVCDGKSKHTWHYCKGHVSILLWLFGWRETLKRPTRLLRILFKDRVGTKLKPGYQVSCFLSRSSNNQSNGGRLQQHVNWPPVKLGVLPPKKHFACYGCRLDRATVSKALPHPVLNIICAVGQQLDSTTNQIWTRFFLFKTLCVREKGEQSELNFCSSRKQNHKSSYTLFGPTDDRVSRSGLEPVFPLS